MTKGLISKGIKKGTKSRDGGLNPLGVTATSKMNMAPKDGAVLETMELFQQKFRTTTSSGYDDTDGDMSLQAEATMAGKKGSPPCILPSGWGKRLKKPGKVYKYSKLEILEYNEIAYLDGPEAAKAWADRRWHERESI